MIKGGVAEDTGKEDCSSHQEIKSPSNEVQSFCLKTGEAIEGKAAGNIYYYNLEYNTEFWLG